MEEREESVHVIKGRAELLDSKKHSKSHHSQKNEKTPEIITIDENDADISVGECNPNDLVVVDSWEAEREAVDSKNFVWDACPSSNENERIFYKTNFKSILREYGEDKTAKAPDAPRNCCFNCMGDHMMSDCPEPRDQQKIAKNRRAHMNKNGGMKQTRYHLAEEQIYAHLAPGKISSELRKALDLAEDQLPRHIYMMRNMGYPPAWLEELKLYQSGVAMFDSNDREDDTSFEKTVMYDISKIIEYPGYNVKPASGTLDESWNHRCPQMLDNQSKDAMIKHMESLNKAAEIVRKELALHAESLVCADRDMIVIDAEGEPDEAQFSAEVSKSALDSPMPHKDTDSPTLEDLETQKKLLMEELEVSCKAYNAEPYATPEQIANVGKVKHVDLGTPILKSASPYSKIPAPDNFSQGICDVINFENLPNSTGHYKRMNNLILKIRKSLTSDTDKSEMDTTNGTDGSNSKN